MDQMVGAERLNGFHFAGPEAALRKYFHVFGSNAEHDLTAGERRTVIFTPAQSGTLPPAAMICSVVRSSGQMVRARPTA